MHCPVENQQQADENYVLANHIDQLGGHYEHEVRYRGDADAPKLQCGGLGRWL